MTENKRSRSKMFRPYIVALIENHMSTAETVMEGAKSSSSWINKHTSLEVTPMRVYKYWMNRRYKGDEVALKGPKVNSHATTSPTKSATTTTEEGEDVAKTVTADDFAILRNNMILDHYNNVSREQVMEYLRSIDPITTVQSIRIVDWKNRKITFAVTWLLS